MDYQTFIDHTNRIHCLGRSFRRGRLGDGYYVQVDYLEEDVITGKLERQLGRKWYVPPDNSPDQIFQTCLKAVLTSYEHQVREHFTVDGYAVFEPHYSVETLIDLRKNSDA